METASAMEQRKHSATKKDDTPSVSAVESVATGEDDTSAIPTNLELDWRLRAMESELTIVKKTVGKMKRQAKHYSANNIKKRKRAANGYIYWSNTHDGGQRQKLIEELSMEQGQKPTMNIISKKLGAMWKEMSETDRQTYKVLAAKAHENGAENEGT